MTRQEVMNQANILEAWDTSELQEAFTVLGFSLGCCVVQCKKTGNKGSLVFDRFEVEGKPIRLYHSLVWDK